MKRLFLALQFLTILPVRIKGDVSEKDMAESSIFFPVAGAFQGFLVIVTTMLFSRIFSAEITSMFVVILLAVSNAGFHLDGVADTFDALAVKSAGDRGNNIAKRLAVMEDSQTGAIGASALILIILIKYLLINNLLLYSTSLTRYSLLFLMPVFSKWSMLPAMYHGSSAKEEGLGRIFADNVSKKEMAYASLIVLVFSLIVSELLQHTAYAEAVVYLLILIFVTHYIFSWLFARFCKEKFGGMTGDTFGALGELSEIIFLIIGSLWLQHSI